MVVAAAGRTVIQATSHIAYGLCRSLCPCTSRPLREHALQAFIPYTRSACLQEPLSGPSHLGRALGLRETMASAAPEQIAQNKMFGGFSRRFRHASDVLGCNMTFTIFFPPAAEAGKVPIIYFLSGLTCTDENFTTKAGAQRKAAELGIALVAPDTSPRGLNVPGEADSWDFGVGAGFYLNATQDKWRNWRMYDYITQELPQLLAAQFPQQLDSSSAAIMGHSMGGHGALTIALKNPGSYKSVSAFAPICNPIQVPWGQKAFAGFLGEEDKEAWTQYDACELMRQYKGPQLPLLVDTGGADSFLQVQLKPEALEAACKEASYPATIRLQEGYDHSYFFISTFIDEHIAHHAAVLKA